MIELKNSYLEWSFTKTLIIFAVIVVSFTSCRGFMNSEPNENDQEEIEKIIEEKLGPDMTLEDWGVTMEEFEAAYYGSLNIETGLTSAPVEPAVWEAEYGTALQIGDDDCRRIELEFPFTFYGDTYSELWVNSNGNVTFGSCNIKFWPTSIPDGDKSMIGTIYGDFAQSQPDTVNWDVYINTVGTAPNRSFVVTWLNVKAYGWPGTNTFQAQLFEESNNILYAYNGLSTNGFNNINGTKMHVGISSNGTFVLSASGSEVPELDGKNICYKPNGEGYTEIFGSCNALTASAGSDQTVECQGKITPVVLDGSGSSDPDGKDLTYSWKLNGSEIASGVNPSVPLEMGSHEIELTVTNSDGKTGSDTVVINVVDTTAPDLDYLVNQQLLWPPNNQMELSISGISAVDICDSNPLVDVTVTSNETNNMNGSWDIVTNSNGTIDVYLRAQRVGKKGRIYTVNITSSDISGNKAEEIIKVTVPHSFSSK